MMHISEIDDEDDRSRRAAYSLAMQAVAPQNEGVPAAQLDQINRIGEISSRAVGEMAHPSLNDGKRNGNDELSRLQASRSSRPAPKAVPIGESHFPELQRVMSAASGATIISSQEGSSVNAASSSPLAPQAPNDPEAAEQISDEAIRYLERVKARAESGKFSVDQLADALAVPREEILEHALTEAAHKLAQKEERKEGSILHNYPDVAKEMLHLGLKMEAFKTGELEGMKKRGDAYRQKIQTQLKFSALLDTLPSNKDSHNLQEALLDPLSKPDKPRPEGSLTKEEIEQCIKEVFPTGSYVISKEQLSGGKVRLNDLMGENKTALTNLLTTEISIAVHLLQMLTQMMQEIAKKQHQLVSSIVNHYGGR